jgi:pyruvate-formate lyase-activating enzyme
MDFPQNSLLSKCLHFLVIEFFRLSHSDGSCMWNTNLHMHWEPETDFMQSLDNMILDSELVN